MGWSLWPFLAFMAFGCLFFLMLSIVGEDPSSHAELSGFDRECKTSFVIIIGFIKLNRL